ncbi:MULTISPECIES: nucleotide exchange factor GrpE [Halomonadaceae]|uniref:nucleotide exchange factor GrpE n=1 Tax=Halomonadaceae TaxID=28256 RepID=UPI001D189E17|nr:nucleotide exchange factor GrpE [Halomonas meridiana]MCC4288165.1 nucleotide exchange factor GrpE [Halomonas meridiana]MCO7243556.1 nucleotide exchange factor GrpE [Halomonas sp. Ps84H-12]MCP1303624.1 nucleotide exchange factor GrpE [Halomonas sp. R1t8]MCP1329597.1 nucleotide exchange factor GrpE [Halomonas sp. R1t4]
MSEIAFNECLKGHAQPVPGKDVRITKAASLRSVAEHNLIRVDYRRRVRCQSCVKAICRVCRAPYLSQSAPMAGDPSCEGCGGTGVQGFMPYSEEHCLSCDGQGLVEKRERIRVALKPRFIDNTKFPVKVQGQGSEGLNGGEAGDLYIEVEVEHPPHLKVEGKHLIAVVEVPYLAMVFPAEVEVAYPTLKGHEHYPFIEGYTPGRPLYFRGRGGYVRGDAKRGDIRYDIELVGSDLEKQAAEKIQTLEADREKEVRQARDETITALTNDLLPAIDGLEKAISSMTGPEDAAHRQGLEMIIQMQRDALAQHGVEVIQAERQRFDPERHEAVGIDHSTGLGKGVVTEVLQTGYIYAGRLLRPPLVKVSG